jgi:hypothetical protein
MAELDARFDRPTTPGIEEIFVWPGDDLEEQLARFTQEVAPFVGDG